jgi:NADH:ubiquinone oxidoreductase subunit E
MTTQQTSPNNDPLSIPEKRMVIDRIIAENKEKLGATMLVLNELQNEIGFISEPMQVYVAKQLRVPVGSIHGVVTFYSFFTTKPRGEHTIKFCLGTACYVAGASQLIDKAKQLLNADLGQTTEDGLITLEACRCVGACSQAPVVVVDEDLHGRVTPNKFPQLVRKCQKHADETK